jgi:hypothetical protein
MLPGWVINHRVLWCNTVDIEALFLPSEFHAGFAPECGAGTISWLCSGLDSRKTASKSIGSGETAMIAAKEVACPICKSTAALRISRKGFWQTMVLASIGIYPWKCGACGGKFLFRNRGYRGLPPSQTHAERRRRHAA